MTLSELKYYLDLLDYDDSRVMIQAGTTIKTIEHVNHATIQDKGKELEEIILIR